MLIIIDENRYELPLPTWGYYSKVGNLVVNVGAPLHFDAEGCHTPIGDLFVRNYRRSKCVVWQQNIILYTHPRLKFHL